MEPDARGATGGWGMQSNTERMNAHGKMMIGWMITTQRLVLVTTSAQMQKSMLPQRKKNHDDLCI